MLVQSELLTIFNDLLGQKARLRKGGIQATYHCPFCADKNLVTQKLEIALSGPKIGNYHCWRCNTKGQTFGSLLKKLKAPQRYREILFKLTGDIRLARSKKIDVEKYVQLPEEFIPLSVPHHGVECRNALIYLKKRGILPEDIVRYNIGYCEKGDYAYHIIVPSYDAKGMLNFFMGRRYYAEDPGIPHKKPEVSMDVVGFESFLNYSEPINMCEGVFDAIAIRNNAVPLFGKYPSKKLREKIIINGTKQVNMVLDDDAKHDAMKNCVMLTKDLPGVDVCYVNLSGKDPSVLGFEKTHELIRAARPLDFMDFLTHRLEL